MLHTDLMVLALLFAFFPLLLFSGSPRYGLQKILLCLIFLHLSELQSIILSYCVLLSCSIKKRLAPDFAGRQEDPIASFSLPFFDDDGSLDIYVIQGLTFRLEGLLLF